MATKKESTADRDRVDVPRLGEQDVETVPVGEDPGDTHRKMVVQVGPEYAPQPENALVQVKEDVIVEFTHPGAQRTSQKMVAAAGTVTTRRLAEEMGLESGQYSDYEQGWRGIGPSETAD